MPSMQLPNFRCVQTVGVVVLLVSLLSGSALVAQTPEATLLRFRNNPVTTHTIVRLGDLIEIVRGKSASLTRALEAPIGPAPRVGSRQTWHSSDVLQQLDLRGVHSSSIAWTGPSKAQLQRIDSQQMTVGQDMLPAFVTNRILTQAENNVAAAIGEYISLKTGERTQFEISAKVANQYAKTLQIRRNIVSVGGGDAEMLGQQKFVLGIKTKDGTQNIRVIANIKLPPMVVVASRPIRRDEVLTPEALKMKPMSSKKLREAKYHTDFESLIGKQMRRSLSSGQPLTEEIVGDPIIISRGQMLTVECVSGGITVSSSARSLGAGAIGELIQVEMAGRQRIQGTVMGPMTVRVAAGSSSAAR